MSADRRWRVELTRASSDQVRGLSPVVRRSIAAALDQLGERGPGRAAEDPGEVRSRPTPSGHVVRYLVLDSDRVVLVIGVEAPAVSPVQRSRFGLVERLRVALDELRYAARSLRRAPAFTLGVILTLGVGLGGATTIFGLVDTVFRASLPFHDGDRLVRIRSLNLRADGEEFAFNVTPRDYRLVRDGNRVFAGVVAQGGGSLSLIGDGPPLRASAIRVGPGWAELLGIEPMLGRTFTEEEHRIGSDAGVALISHGLWERRFGGDPGIVGRRISHQEGVLEVVGVLRPRFAYPYDADLWRPGSFDPSDWTASDLNIVARLGPGVELDEARADVNRLYASLKAESPGVAPNLGFRVESVRADFIRDDGAALESLAVAVLFLLALVCVNVAGLLTARLVAKHRETSLRAALGAGRARLVQGALAESLLLFAAGAVVALAAAVALGDVVSALIPSVLRDQLDLGSVGIGPAVMAFAGGAALVAGVATGLTAAWRAARADLQSVLRAGSRSVGGSGRLRDVLVVTELALSLGLLVGAGVLAEHFRKLQRADLGFETEGLYSAQLAIQTERYASAEARLALVDRLRAEIESIPGVEGFGVTSVNPLCCGDWGASIAVEGRVEREDEPPLVVHHRYVTADYFEAMEIPIVRGRAFDRSDRVESTPVVIVDADLAARLWPGEDPIGRRVGLSRDGAAMRTVVGVAAPAHANGDERETWYLPFEQEPLGRSNEILHLMTRAASGDVLSGVREATARVDPTLPLFGTSTMDGLRDENIAQDRIGALVVAAFAVAGLLLAGLGVYGLLAYQVELRRRELGTRMALGARRVAVGGLVLRGALRLLAVGLAAGAVLAWGLNGTLTRVVDGVEMAGPGLFTTLAAVLGIVVVLSSAVPAARAVSVEPAKVLGTE